MSEIIKHPAFEVVDDDDLPMPASTFPSVWLKDVRPSLGGNWLIKGIMPGVGTGLVFGESGTYKSYVLLDALLAVASGRDEWGGFRIKRNGVVAYVCAEGTGGIGDRLSAARKMRGIDESEDVPFLLIPARPRLGVEQGDAPKLIETIKQAIPHGVEVVAVVVDTLSQTLGGGDENGSGAHTFIGTLEGIAKEFGCIAFAVHHVGKSDPTRARGHSSIDGDTDFKWLVKRIGDKEASITSDKVKDGKAFGTFGVKLEEVVLGIDDDGDEITSLAVASVGEPVATKATAPGIKLTIGERYLFEMMTRVGDDNPAAKVAKKIDLDLDLPSPILTGVPEDDVRARWMREKVGEHGDKKAKATARQGYNRALLLIEKGLLRRADHAGRSYLFDARSVR
jgi:hypothetical protein